MFVIVAVIGEGDRLFFFYHSCWYKLMMLVVYCMVHGKIMIKKQEHIFKEAAEIVKSLRYATMLLLMFFVIILAHKR